MFSLTENELAFLILCTYTYLVTGLAAADAGLAQSNILYWYMLDMRLGPIVFITSSLVCMLHLAISGHRLCTLQRDFRLWNQCTRHMHSGRTCLSICQDVYANVAIDPVLREQGRIQRIAPPPYLPYRPLQLFGIFVSPCSPILFGLQIAGWNSV